MLHSHALTSRPRATATAALLLCGLLLSGCATTAVQAQWSNPQFVGQSLRGARVLVGCSAGDAAIKSICQDQLAAQVAAAAATPVVATGSAPLVTDSGQPTDEVFAAARRAGAQAIWLATVTPDAAVVSPGPTIGLGFGGFRSSGGWYRSSGVGAGAGLSFPVGGDRVTVAYAANMTLTDVQTGRLIWTSKVSTPASPDIAEQMARLTQAGVGAAQQAGFL